MSSGEEVRKVSRQDIQLVRKPIDLRLQGRVVNEADHQKQARACWIFPALESIENLYLEETGESIRLSRQLVIDSYFHRYPPSPSVREKCRETQTRGGNSMMIFQYAHDFGLRLEDEYREYTGQREDCLDSDKAWSQRVYLGDWKYLERNDDDETSTHENVNEVLGLLQRGRAVVGSVFATDPFCCLKGEIYDGPSREDILMQEVSQNDKPFFVHLVLIVGFSVEDGVEYYIIKNCWGSLWGLDGYAKVPIDFIHDYAYPLYIKDNKIGPSSRKEAEFYWKGFHEGCRVYGI